MKHIIGIILLVAFGCSVSSQNEDTEYLKVLAERSEKIVKTLNITDSEKHNRITKTLTNQYKLLGEINDDFNHKIKVAKEEIKDNTKLEQKNKELYEEKNAKLYNLQCEFIGNLSANLTNDQIESVKDGMTYGVRMVTYKSYNEMIPALKEDEKRQIYAWLTEAREHAMNASSSKDKHGWFNKYKGRINNYLSRQGYDIQKERKLWEERVKAAGGTL
ncbi:MAG: DUF3826 domain-containing protein [Tannerella sp.]|jgi:hypothetical protein|nr:DUF3826 domain-containing protein [Tannerella sp.]